MLILGQTASEVLFKWCWAAPPTELTHFSDMSYRVKFLRGKVVIFLYEILSFFPVEVFPSKVMSISCTHETFLSCFTRLVKQRILVLNPFHFISLKTSENLGFFRGYKMGTLTRNGLIERLKTIEFLKRCTKNLKIT